MIKIYGHSDDLLEVEGEFISQENEISCWRQVVKLEINDIDAGTACVIDAEYAKDNREGVWHIGIEPLEEDRGMPEIKVQLYGNGYSPAFIFDCSRNTSIKVLEKKSQPEE